VTDNPDELFPVQIQADWYAQPDHAGFYLAWKKGFYAERGLKAEVLPGSPNDNTRQKVALGDVTFGVARLEDVIMAIDRGLPLVAVGAYMQRIPLSLMVHADQPIYSVAEIGDRLVMTSAGSLFLPRLEKRYGISLNTIPHTRSIANFLTEPELVQQCYLTNEPYFVEKAGVDVRVLPLYEAGLDSVRVIYCRKAFVDEHPEVVMATVEASHRGWLHYIASDEYMLAHEAIAERNPELDFEFMEWTRGKMLEKQLVTGDPAAGSTLRSISRERVQKMADELTELGLVKRAYTAEEIAAWEIIDPIMAKPEPSL
jgi:NitT/TauT family transport system substrate-binding protein